MTGGGVFYSSNHDSSTGIGGGPSLAPGVSSISELGTGLRYLSGHKGSIGSNGLDHGLLLYSRRQNGGCFGDWLLIARPLVIDPQTADDLLGRLESTLASAARELLSNHA